MTRRAKLFETQEGQAVRLPEEFRFEGLDEVSIYRQGDKLVLDPVRRKWSQAFLDLAGSVPDFPYPDEPPLEDLQEFVANHRRLDLRELRGTGGLRPDYDYKRLRR